MGQGQSVALLSQGATALVDCGGSSDPGDTAATYLQSLGRSRLDLLWCDTQGEWIDFVC